MKNKVYLIWLINDDVDPMVVGIATSEDVYVKEKLRGNTIFMPVSWEEELNSKEKGK